MRGVVHSGAHQHHVADMVETLKHTIKLGAIELVALLQNGLRNADFAHIVHDSGDPDLLDLIFCKMDIGEGAKLLKVDILGDAFRQFRHATGMAGRMRTSRVDGLYRVVHQRFEQVLDFGYEQRIINGHRRLAGQRPDHRFEAGRERHVLPFRRKGVDQLQHTYHFVGMIKHGHHQHRLRAVAGLLIVFLGPGKVETFRLVNVGNIDDLFGHAHMGGDIGVVRLPIHEKRHWRQTDLVFGGPARVVPGRLRLHDFEGEGLLLFVHPVERTGIAVGKTANPANDIFEQPVQILFTGKIDADLIEALHVGLCGSEPRLQLFYTVAIS